MFIDTDHVDSPIISVRSDSNEQNEKEQSIIREIVNLSIQQQPIGRPRSLSVAACELNSMLEVFDLWSLTREAFQNELNCPFECGQNIHMENAQIEINRWVINKKLIPGGKPFKSFSTAKFAFLVGMCHPNCDSNTLVVISKWLSWLFLYDDRCEKIKDADQLEQYCNKNLDILNSRINSNIEDDALSNALCELRDETLSLRDQEWMNYFSQAMKEHFASLRSEKHTIQDLESYIKTRPFTGAPFVVFTLMLWAENITLPSEILQSDYLQRLNLACGNIICWSNDIISFPKESFDGDNNIIFILLIEKKMSFPEAIEYVVDMHNKEIEKFIQATCDEPFVQHQQMVEKYIAGLRSWMKAHVEWSLISGRYMKPDLSRLQGEKIKMETIASKADFL